MSRHEQIKCLKKKSRNKCLKFALEKLRENKAAHTIQSFMKNKTVFT